MRKFELEPVTDFESWRVFLKSSAQGTVYLDSDLLSIFGQDTRLFWLLRNGNPVAGAPVFAHGQESARRLPFCYYQGLVFSRDIWCAKLNRRTSSVIEISEVAMEFLTRQFDSVRLELHPTVTDVRGFDWFNYHEPKLGRASILPRYTAVFDLTTCGSESDIRQKGHSSRRQEERYARERDGLSVLIDNSVTDLIGLYRNSFSKQELDAPHVENLAPLSEYAIGQRKGCILKVVDDVGLPKAAALLLPDYGPILHVPIVGTGDSRYAGSLLYLAILDWALENGFECVDFNGANSPKRGYFKHSFGAEPRLYFEISWSRPRLGRS